MTSLVKNAFLVIMGVTVAMLLYFAFFGFNVSEHSDGMYTGSNWDGAIWWAANAMQIPISRYYYEYCYLPAYNGNSDISILLGSTDIRTNIQTTPSNATVSAKYSDSSSSEYCYSTGWK